MASDPELSAFVKDALARGIPRAQIKEALLSAGWMEKQACKALTSYAELEFPIPVPKPKANGSAREFFLYAVLLVSLSFTAYYLGDLIFQLINLAYPATSTTGFFPQNPTDEIRWSVASLIVAFSVYLVVCLLSARDIKKDASKRASKYRYLLVYTILFITVIIGMSDLTILLYHFLRGEVGMPFFLKVLTVGIITAAIFGYYLFDLRGAEAGLHEKENG